LNDPIKSKARYSIGVSSLFLLASGNNKFFLNKKAEPTLAKSTLAGNDKAINSAYVEIVSKPDNYANAQENGVIVLI